MGVAVLIGSVTPTCFAGELGLNAGYIHLPASSYHYLGYEARLGFGPLDRQFVIDFGMTHPNSAAGYSQHVTFGSLEGQWTLGNDSVKPYIGLGVGFFNDSVSSSSASSSGFVPAFLLRGGLKMGGSHAGVTLGFSSYLGIYSVSQLFHWTMWPMNNVMAGVYVAL